MLTAKEMMQNSTYGVTDVAVNATITIPEYNPWADVSPGQQIVEIVYLTMLAILGTVGNLTVIFSIALERRVHSNGNIFVINLAVADLMITGFVVPTVIANVIAGENALPMGACMAAGFIVTVTCTCSLYNLTGIAINRYQAVVHSRSYIERFTKKNVYVMVVFSWVWSCALALPTLVGWSRVMYDAKMQLCSWDDDFVHSYTIFLTILAVFIPLTVIFACYARLFVAVRKSGKWVRSLSSMTGAGQGNDQHRRSVRKERNLLHTLATTVAFFCICWLPYGFIALIGSTSIDPLPKKIFGWLALTNSAVNFVIYGVMNPIFRRGYRNLFYLLIKCERVRRVGSNIIHASHSDSLYRSAVKRRSNPPTPQSVRASKAPNVIIRQSSAPNLKQHMKNGSEGTLVFTPYATPQMGLKMNGAAQDSPQRPASAVVGGAKPTVTSSLAVLKRPTSLLRREKPSSAEQKKNDREGRLKRNSLMLLQIEMSEEEDPMLENRLRTRSEIPIGTRRPGKKRTSSTVQCSHSLGDADTTTHYKNREERELKKESPTTEDKLSADGSNSEISEAKGEKLLSPDSLSTRLSSIRESEEKRESRTLEPFSRSERLRRSMKQKEEVEGAVVDGSDDSRQSVG